MKNILVKNNDKLIAIEKNVTTNKERVIWNKNMNISIPYYKKFINRDNLENIISSEVVSGWTIEAQERLSEKVLDNVIEFMKNYGS